MAVNPNWARWAFASVATFMKQLAADANIPALVEGLDERTTEYMEAANRVEIRMSGPFTKELSKDYYELGVDINVKQGNIDVSNQCEASSSAVRRASLSKSSASPRRRTVPIRAR